jgi:hypothetical protein
MSKPDVRGFGYTDEEWDAAIEAGYRILQAVAARQAMIDYTDFCTEVRAACDVEFVPGEFALPHLLGAISSRSLADHDVAITSLVVYRSGNRKGDPGPGLFALAKEKGLLPSDATDRQKDAFVIEHVKRAYELWTASRRRPGERFRR